MVEHVRCGEVRRIPITFDNDTRRERDVKLQLGGFATESRQEIAWESSLSETAFKLSPCGEKTAVGDGGLREVRTASAYAHSGADPTPGHERQRAGRHRRACAPRSGWIPARWPMPRCAPKAAPSALVIAVAVLPESCGAHEASCGCGCCH